MCTGTVAGNGFSLFESKLLTLYVDASTDCSMPAEHYDYTGWSKNIHIFFCLTSSVRE